MCALGWVIVTLLAAIVGLGGFAWWILSGLWTTE